MNTRSLPKNINLIEELLYSINNKPDVIAISETKLNENNENSIFLRGYNFVHVNSPTNAGGVGLFISQKLTYQCKKELSIKCDNTESLFIELKINNSKTGIIV